MLTRRINIHELISRWDWHGVPVFFPCVNRPCLPLAMTRIKLLALRRPWSEWARGLFGRFDVSSIGPLWPMRRTVAAT